MLRQGGNKKLLLHNKKQKITESLRFKDFMAEIGIGFCGARIFFRLRWSLRRENSTASTPTARCIRPRRRSPLSPSRALGFKSLLQQNKKAVLCTTFLFWRRRRDLNPRASCPTYTLSRGASSPLEYFSKVKMCSYYSLLRGGLSLNPPPVKSLAERVGFEPTWACTQTVFKTASL